MVEDARQSRKPVSSVTTVASNEANPVTALELRPEQTMALEDIHAQYGSGATVEAVIEVFDEESGTNAGDLGDKVDEFRLNAGDDKNPDMAWRDIENDVVLLPAGNLDSEVTVTVGGYTISG